MKKPPYEKNTIVILPPTTFGTGFINRQLGLVKRQDEKYVWVARYLKKSNRWSAYQQKVQRQEIEGPLWTWPNNGKPTNRVGSTRR